MPADDGPGHQDLGKGIEDGHQQDGVRETEDVRAAPEPVHASLVKR